MYNEEVNRVVCIMFVFYIFVGASNCNYSNIYNICSC